MKKLLAIMIALTLTLSVLCCELWASCASYRGISEEQQIKMEFESSAAVFVGAVTDIRLVNPRCRSNQNYQCPENVTLSVTKRFKNVPQMERQIVLPNWDQGISEGGYLFKVGKEYLVYAYRDERKQLRTTLCSRTMPIERTAEDLKVLRGLTNRN